MWLVGFGLAVLCYWRQVGALNAFGLVAFNIDPGHTSIPHRFHAAFVLALVLMANRWAFMALLAE
jgi:hypothetical protein